MSRAAVVAIAPAALIAFGACGEGRPAGAPPGAGAGYEDAPAPAVRVLSHDDCVALRDHQIEIAVGAALGAAGDDPGRRLEIEAKLRAEMKGKTDEWVRNCAGRVVEQRIFRCWKEASTPATLVACDAHADAGAKPASDAAKDDAAKTNAAKTDAAKGNAKDDAANGDAAPSNAAKSAG